MDDRLCFKGHSVVVAFMALDRYSALVLTEGLIADPALVAFLIVRLR